MKKQIVTALASALLISTSAFAEMPPKAKMCVGCHGADGNSVVPNFPKLAGQHSAYLEKALKDYRDGFRHDATMKSFAKGLSDAEVTELATYFSSQKAK